ncbi:MAG: hypothetical protein JWQ76_1321, partial [Ramlibacter sp.]|nr:hypothetical protein [Ramlibacter sp.]
MSTENWISRGVSLWRPGFEKPSAGATREGKPRASATAAVQAPAARTTRERL